MISRKIRIEYNRQLFDFWIFNVNFGILNEEFFPGIYRDVYSVGLGVQRVF